MTRSDGTVELMMDASSKNGYYYYEYTIVVQVGDEMTVWPRVSLDVAQHIPTAPTASLITDRNAYKVSYEVQVQIPAVAARA